jgi:hypothetical protein
MRNSTLVFFLILFIDNVVFSCLDSISFCSEDKIVNHIFAQHKLAKCCLQCCMIGASNILLTMWLVEGSYQMDYLNQDDHGLILSQIS